MKLHKRLSFILISTLLLTFNFNLYLPTYGAITNSDIASQQVIFKADGKIIDSTIQLFQQTVNNTTTPSILHLDTSYDLNSDTASKQITFKINSQWDNSFTGEILITNTSDTPLSNWELQFNLPYDIISLWNAKIFRSPNLYTLECEDYNSVLYPNQTISIGFIANYDSDITLPVDYTFKADGKIIESTIQVSQSPINNRTTPSILHLDTPYELNFTSSEDELWLSFTPTTSASYEFISQGNAHSFTSLYDETQQDILSTNKDTCNTKLLGATLLANKEYYIKVNPLNFDLYNSDFNLTVNQIRIPDDPLFSKQWALLNTFNGLDINILPVWSHLNTSNSPISMADTGVYYTHEDLAENINLDLSYNFTHHTNNVFPENELYKDAYTAIYGHGTHVAGIIGSVINNNTGIAGIVPSADLVSFKALGRRLQGTTTYTKSIAAFVEAVDFAQENNIHLMNCSFGGTSPSEAEKQAMLQANDILFVIAAGNSGNDLEESPTYPACYYHSNSLVVANVDSNGNLDRSSNYGGPTDIAAPGTNIISTMPYDRYEYMSGTSMATPFVTGTCSLVWAQNPSLTPEEVKSYVTNSVNVTTLDSLLNTTLSGGMLNAYKAVVCPSLNNESRNMQAFRDPFSGNKKDKITYYKKITPDSDKTEEIIVKFNDSSQINDWINKLNNFYDFGEISVNNYLESIDAYVLKFKSIDSADIAIDFLNKSDEIIYAEPNYIRE